MAQSEFEVPTGLAGGFGGSVNTGGGSFDPYERNASRSITDIVVPGAVVPFAYTRIWNSRSGWRTNWSWEIDENLATESNDRNDNLFRGYTVKYPDGRVVKFNKPTSTTPRGGAGTYSPGTLIQDRFVVLADRIHAELRLTDGNVVTFTGMWDTVDSCAVGYEPTSIVDPHGLAVSFSFSEEEMATVIKEPGGRKILIHYDGSGMVTTSVGQSVKYTSQAGSGLYPYSAGSYIDPDDDNIKTSRDTVIYNDVIDPATGHAVEAHYVYKQVQPPTSVPNGPLPDPRYRLIWASDPMFDGPLQQIKYTYVDNTSAPTGDFYMTAVLEERSAPNYWDPNLPRYHDPGVLVSRIEMLPWTYSQLDGNSEGYFTRKETRGDGAVRTISYFNPTKVHRRLDGSNGIGQGQTMVDHFTDFKNDPSKVERHEYDWATDASQPQFQTPTRITDARGKVTLQTLDPVLGHLTRQTHVADNSYRSWTYTDPANPYYVETSTDENTHQTRYTRDPNTHRVTRIDYPDSSYETFSYNDFGQVLIHRMTTGGTESFGYDEGLTPNRGLKTSHTDPFGNVTHYYYYPSGPSTDRLQRVQDPRGNSTWYEYNGRGQVTKVTHQDGTYTQSSYNGNGTLAWTADENHPGAATDPTQRTRYTYDEYKRVRTVTNPMGETTTTSYELNWADPLLHTTNNPKYINTPTGKTTIFDYDANFRKMDQVVALGTADEAWTFFEYDDVGNLTKITDPRFKETRFEYDGRNRKMWMDDPIATDRNLSGHTMNWEYDFVGNKTRETRADNAFRTWEYDVPNRTTRAIDWRMSVSETAVTTTHVTDLPNALNVTLEHVIDAKGAEYKIEFDALHRKTSETYPLDFTNVARTETFQYDPAGNLRLYKNPAGQYKHLDYLDSYDSRNRLRHASWNLSSSNTAADWNVGQEVRTDYDDADRMTQIKTNNGETIVAFGYDGANRQVSEDQTLAGYPTRHLDTPRDNDGNRAYLYLPGYYLLYYDYNQRNQLWHIRDGNNSPAWTYTYDPAGNVTNRLGQWVYANGVNFAYDDLNRITQIEQGDSSVVFARSHYQYDNVGREVARWRDEEGGKGERFGYNTNSQLTSAIYKADNVSTGNPSNWASRRDYAYTPDLLNWVSVNDNGHPAPFSVNGLNQYTNINGSAAQYDERFNLSQFGGMQYNYDAPSHLVAVAGNGHSASFTYDGLGRCVRRTIDNVPRLFTYDGWSAIMEWDGNGNWTAINIYGAKTDEILGRYDAARGAMIYKQDNQGNVVFLLNGNSQIIERYTYDAYGRPTVTNGDGTGARSSSNYGNRFMYTGREWLWELSLYDYRHRFYYPDIGRFLQTDPTGFDAGDMNLFRYCGADPVDKSDPTGLLDRNWNAAVRAIDQAETIPFFQAEARSMIFAQIAAAVQQIPVAGNLDSAARALGARLVEVSRTNSDNSPSGTGWERGKTIGLVHGKPVEGDRTNVAYKGTRFSGPQTIDWTDAPPGASKYVFVHAHTSTARDREHNTMTSPADRLGANQAHSPIYTVAADPHGGYITERYRPSAVKQDRIQGINGVTELWRQGQWQPISN